MPPYGYDLIIHDFIFIKFSIHFGFSIHGGFVLYGLNWKILILIFVYFYLFLRMSVGGKVMDHNWHYFLSISFIYF